MDSIPSIVEQQKAFFKSQKTKDVSYRLVLLKALKAEIISQESTILEALKKDFKKSEFETYISEFGLVISSLNLVIKNLKKWTKPQRVKSSLLTFPSKDYIYKQPYGCVLVIAPWNYPFLLALEPLIMAIAAGNTVVLKPSELTKNTSKILFEIIENVLPSDLAKVIEGDAETASKLLHEKWNYIFFTGSTKVGKIVAKAAANHLTPVTLELGGKSPCIIDDTINLKLVARRIVWGKFFNGGQTCIAPDFLIVKDTIKPDLIEALKTEILKRYGNHTQASELPQIISKENTERIALLLKNQTIIHRGDYDIDNRYMSPTLIDNPILDSPLMQEEIFGPILPILSYKNNTDIEHIIDTIETPLAFYIFSKDTHFIESTIQKFSFGGGVVNDTLVHFGNHKLPFGGIGASGMGNYHGKHGFDIFSHKKSIMKRGTIHDPSFRYLPYKGKLPLLKKIFKYFG